MTLAHNMFKLYNTPKCYIAGTCQEGAVGLSPALVRVATTTVGEELSVTEWATAAAAA